MMQSKKAEPANRSVLRTLTIVFIVCCCGWFTMELEILGVRVLSPYFGSAVYVVMGSVIGVFLLSLSAGYMFGGWLSRKANSKLLLAFNLIAAGAWLCAMPFFTGSVCDGIFNIGLDEKWGSLIAAIILFGIPTMLIGTVSPTAVRWLTKQASDSGFNTGMVLAFSTAASFAGCIVTAFYLVILSVQRTICASGIALVALGGAILLQAAIQGRKGTSNDVQGK